MTKIAIIGTNGAGKTVFISVLAHRLNQRPTDDFVLDPEPMTFKYIETNWHTLNHREWPSHTTRGMSLDLRWKLKLSMPDGIRDGEMRVIDASGHDIRSIFADDAVTAMDALPAAQRSVAEYCRAADVAIFVADLNDYIEKPDSLQNIEGETILKSAMDFLRKHSRKYCLVLAKADMYRDYIAQEGGWPVVAAKHLSSIHRSHLESGVPSFQIACVNKTETIVDGDSTRIVPIPGFDSDGLDPFVEWLVTNVGGVSPAESAPHPVAPQPTPWPVYIAAVLALFVFLSTAFATVTHWFSPDVIVFAPVSILFAVVVFIAVWGMLSGLRWAVNSIKNLG